MINWEHYEGRGRITAECANCGFHFDPGFGLDCPACTAIRETESRKAYLHQAHIAKCEVCSFHYDTNKSPNCPTCAIQALRDKLSPAEQDEDAPVEAPRGLRMPLGDAAQIYELRRLFRL